MTTPRRPDQRVLNVTISAERYAALKSCAKSISMSLTGIVNGLIGDYLRAVDEEGTEGAGLARRVDSLEKRLAVIQAELEPQRRERRAACEAKERQRARRAAIKRNLEASVDALIAPIARELDQTTREPSETTLPNSPTPSAGPDNRDAAPIASTAPTFPPIARGLETRSEARPIERAARVSNQTGVALASTFPQRRNETASDRAIRYALRPAANVDVARFY